MRGEPHFPLLAENGKSKLRQSCGDASGDQTCLARLIPIEAGEEESGST